jgi:hypothetical protein
VDSAAHCGWREPGFLHCPAPSAPLAEKLGFPVERFQGPGRTGSSTLLAAMFGLMAKGYDAVLVAGAPLEGVYETFQGGWIEARHIIGGRVFSMSGWTKTYLEGLNHGLATV